MPTCYSFTDRISGKVLTLDEVDKVACELSGAVYSATNYCGLFQFATMAGILPRLYTDNKLDASKLREYLAQPELELSESQQAAIVELLCTRHQFDAWYQVGR